MLWSIILNAKKRHRDFQPAYAHHLLVNGWHNSKKAPFTHYGSVAQAFLPASFLLLCKEGFWSRFTAIKVEEFLRLVQDVFNF
jgi:hypothetical protein